MHILNKRDQRLHASVSEPKKSDEIILIIPGYGSSSKKESNIKRQKLLTENGLNSAVLDLSGKGESDGEFEKATISDWIEDTLEFINYFEKKYKHISLLGTSMGGLVAMNAAIRHPVYRMMLRAPVSEIIDKPARFVNDARNHTVWSRLSSIKCPVFIIHGDKDESVPVSQSKKLAKELNAKLEIVNSDHSLSGFDQKIVEFFTKSL